MNGPAATPGWAGTERRHRVLTDEDARALGEHITEQLIQRLTDERVAEQVISVWSGHLDKQIGKGVRRLLLYVALVLAGFAALKFELFSKFLR